MRYVQKDANGRLRYRRGIPKRLRPFFGNKREFLKVLGKTEEEALQRYAKVNLRFDKKLDAAKKLMPAGAKRAVRAVDLAKALTALGISAEKSTKNDEKHNRDYLIEEILQEFGSDTISYEYVDISSREAVFGQSAT